jgi:two-component system NtrC family sensor kinase
MRFLFLLIFISAAPPGLGQKPVLHLASSSFSKDIYYISIGDKDGWLYKSGNDAAWAATSLDVSGWIPLKPVQVKADMADTNGKVEGWFRLTVTIDSTLARMPLSLKISTWAAVDLYVDGKKLYSHGDARPISAHKYRSVNTPLIPVTLSAGEAHVIALHFVDYLSPWHLHKLRSESADSSISTFIQLTGPDFQTRFTEHILRISNYSTFWISILALLSVMFWFLFFQNRNQRTLLLIAIYSTAGALNIYFIYYAESTQGISFTAYIFSRFTADLFGRLYGLMVPILLINIFQRPLPIIGKALLYVLAVLMVIDVFVTAQRLQIIIVMVGSLYSVYLLVSSWKYLKGAQWFVVSGLITAMSFSVVYMINYDIHKSVIFPYALFYATGIYISFPVFLMVYVAARFREIIAEMKLNTEKIIQLSEEKKEQALNQQKMLEAEVARQTVELRNSLENLKATQSQLIQSEKMASLGELTAGIAHEIQNPLNFVNNFSEVNKELLAEMEAAIENGYFEEARALAKDITDNQEKINHHGKRAADIVKGMLQHSRSSSGQKEPTDINALCDEYLRLSYHGLRAKDKSFNAKFEADFDSSLPKINVVPQDIGRVILNLINNAFYAVNDRANNQQLATNNQTYEPTVTVSTKKLSDKIEIRVKDNGPGIPDSIKGKIFQPFFTTKPTGQGTGLGLSISYDIISKGHEGELKVETQVGAGTKFIINLPIK